MANRGAAGGSSLSQTSLGIMGVGATRSVPVGPSSPMASLELFGVLWGLLPCPALVRVAISLDIWFPNSVLPSTGSVVTTDLALTLSWALSFLLSAL